MQGASRITAEKERMYLLLRGLLSLLEVIG